MVNKTLNKISKCYKTQSRTIAENLQIQTIPKSRTIKKTTEYSERMRMDLQQSDRIFEEKQRVLHKKRPELFSHRIKRTKIMALFISFKNAADDINTN